MQPRYSTVLRQVAFFVLALWALVTLTYFLPDLVGLQPGPQAQDAFFTSQPSVSYGDYLSQVSHLDFGYSQAIPTLPVDTLVGRAVPWTVGLVGFGTLISLTLGTLLGMVLAWRRGSILDTLFTSLALFAGSIPYYFVALILVYAVGLDLGWFPVGDPYSPNLVPHLSRAFLLDLFRHAVLPVTAVVAATFGLWVMPMRNAMVAIMDDDFMALGRAKGLGTRRLALSYAARNVALPVATNFAIQLGQVVGGAVFVELVFNYPGLGWLLVQSVVKRDYPTVQALVLLMATVVLLCNVIVRALHPWLDPRLSHE